MKMLKSYVQRFIQNFTFVIPSIYGLLITLIFLRFYEFFSYQNNSLEEGIKISYLNGGLVIDFIFSNLFVFIILIFQSLFFYRVIKKRYVINIFSCLALFLNFILTNVFIITFEPLDEVFYHFTFKELSVITGGEAIDSLVFLSVIILFFIFYLSFNLMKRIKFSRSKTIIFLIITLISLSCFPFLTYKSEKHIGTKLVNNKLVYFASKSIKYFSENQRKDFKLSKIDTEFLGGESINDEFPLMHEFKIDNNFADLFKVNSKKPPNLVFIIVEGLSTQFVGKYAKKTGNLMPFLDSLSTKSVYFPNVISTAERTFNVLPAVFSSTINAPESQSFMSLEFPKHWALMDLLRKNYFSRFYCGVYSEFDRMDRYLEYHETDFIVKKWEKKFNSRFSKSNFWGYPDNQLFEKSMLDLENKHSNLKKSRLDVILTVSTHDPFVFPNQEKITKELRNEINRIKNKNNFQKNCLNKIKKYATYRYTDQSLRSYFQKIKKDKDYENTIFFILGDHGSAELHNLNELNRATTPLLIVSDLLKKPMMFEELSSHLDILPSVLSLLNKNYSLSIPEAVPFLGKGLRLNKKYETNLYQVIASINHKNSFLVYDDYYLYFDQLFKIKKDLQLKEIKNPSLLSDLKQKLSNYSNLSNYCIYGDKMIPETIFENHWNSSLFKMYKSNYHREINTSDDYIIFGKDFLIKEKCEEFKFEINLDYFLNNEKELENMPNFTACVGKNDSMYVWKQARLTLNQTYKKGWNKVKYVLNFSKKEMNKISDFKISYYIYNPKKKIFYAKNFIVKSFMKN